MYFDRLNRVPRTILLIPIRFFNIIFIGFQGQERERERDKKREREGADNKDHWQRQVAQLVFS
jgi:hypothetical protein